MWFPRDERKKLPKPLELAEDLAKIPGELGKAGKEFLGGLINGPKGGASSTTNGNASGTSGVLPTVVLPSISLTATTSSEATATPSSTTATSTTSSSATSTTSMPSTTTSDVATSSAQSQLPATTISPDGQTTPLPSTASTSTSSSTSTQTISSPFNMAPGPGTESVTPTEQASSTSLTGSLVPTTPRPIQTASSGTTESRTTVRETLTASTPNTIPAPTATSAPLLPASPVAGDSKNTGGSDLKGGHKAAIVLGSTLTIGLVAIAILLYFRWRRRQQHQSLCLPRTFTPTRRRPSAVQRISDRLPFSVPRLSRTRSPQDDMGEPLVHDSTGTRGRQIGFPFSVTNFTPMGEKGGGGHGEPGRGRSWWNPLALNPYVNGATGREPNGRATAIHPNVPRDAGHRGTGNIIHVIQCQRID